MYEPNWTNKDRVTVCTVALYRPYVNNWHLQNSPNWLNMYIAFSCLKHLWNTLEMPKIFAPFYPCGCHIDSIDTCLSEIHWETPFISRFLNGWIITCTKCLCLKKWGSDNWTPVIWYQRVDLKPYSSVNVHQRVNLHFSHGFPMVFPWFSHGFPMVFPSKMAIFLWSSPWHLDAVAPLRGRGHLDIWMRRDATCFGPQETEANMEKLNETEETLDIPWILSV